MAILFISSATYSENAIGRIIFWGHSSRRIEGRASTVSHHFLGGYLLAVFEADISRWEDTICDLVSDDRFVSIIGPLVAASGLTDKVTKYLIARCDSGDMDRRCLVPLSNTLYWLRKLPAPTLMGFVRLLNDAGETEQAIGHVARTYTSNQSAVTVS